MNKNIKTGLKDRKGNDIHVGDFVTYKVEYNFGNPPVPIYDTPNGTVMIDQVIQYEDKFIFYDYGFGGSLAERHLPYCEVITDELTLTKIKLNIATYLRKKVNKDHVIKMFIELV